MGKRDITGFYNTEPMGHGNLVLQGSNSHSIYFQTGLVEETRLSSEHNKC